jgi:type II restriction/modification system DNA methylase subunit YeeA
MSESGSEAAWPSADVIVGNPPFLGGKLMRNGLGSDYVDRLFKLYKDRVPAEADLVTYWFEKALHQMQAKAVTRVGLVATNSIRGGPNRRVLQRVMDTANVFEAWSDEPWVNEGAAVRVSLIAFGGGQGSSCRLDGHPVERISADLRPAGSSGADLTTSAKLAENASICFMGVTKVGPFDIPGDLARSWIHLPNPHGRSNAVVLRPSWNGIDVTRRPRDTWIVDFGLGMSEGDAACYEAPFAYIEKNVKPERAKNNRENYVKFWWLHGEARPTLRAALARLSRAIVTPEVAKHRIFAWLPSGVLPDKNLHVVIRDDDVTFGVLSSTIHAIWALLQGSSLEDRPRYTPSSTFETFPFPAGLTPNLSASSFGKDKRGQRIASAAVRLNDLRGTWLNPAELVQRVAEVVPGYPDRISPKTAADSGKLKIRTLTNLYNENPAWLQHAQRELDEAVAAAYGWEWPLEKEAVLSRLLELNKNRASA